MTWKPDSFEDYLAHPALSSHGLMKLLKSPAHYKHALENRREPTDAMIFGTLVHLVILEPDSLSQIYVSPVVDRRLKEGKAAYAEWQASLPPKALTCSKEQYDKLMAIRDSVHGNPYARKLLTNGVAEKSGYGTTPDGINFKLRPDYRRQFDGLIIDIKTCANADIHAFQRSIVDYHYDLQAQFYLDHATLVDGMPYKTFCWLCIEKEAPFACEIYAYTDTWSEIARKKIIEAKKRYKDCMEKNDWRYVSKIREINPPQWYLNQFI